MPMPEDVMFTLEINSIPVAVTKGSESEARAAFSANEFRRGLQSRLCEGVPLWDGRDPLLVRAATAAEIRAFVEYAEKMGFEDEEEGEIVLYLRPIDAPEEFDETQDG
jgi:hypothetical protein